MNWDDFFVRHAGKWVEHESPMFGLLPEDGEAIVGGVPDGRRDEWYTNCFVCKATVALAQRDRTVLKEHPKMIVLCATCYVKMEPKEIEEC